jgi:hypothetical protein
MKLLWYLFLPSLFVCIAEPVLEILVLAEDFEVRLPQKLLPCLEPSSLVQLVTPNGIVLGTVLPEFQEDLIVFSLHLFSGQILTDFTFNFQKVGTSIPCSLAIRTFFRPLDLSVAASPSETSSNMRIIPKPRTGYSGIEELREPSTWLVREACLTSMGFEFFAPPSQPLWKTITGEWENLLSSLSSETVVHEREPRTAIVSTYVHQWNRISPAHIRVHFHNSSMDEFAASRRTRSFKNLYVLPPGSLSPYGHLVIDVAIPFSALAHDFGRPSDMAIAITQGEMPQEPNYMLHELLAAGSPGSAQLGVYWLQELEDDQAICCVACVVAGNVDFSVASRRNTAPFYQRTTEFAAAMRSVNGLPPQPCLDASKRTLRAAIVDRRTRRVLNLEQVVEALREVGFGVEVVHLYSMTQKEQLQLGIDIDLLFSVHGADLVHMMYMRTGAEVIEVRPYCWKVNPEFDFFATAVGVHMQIIRIRDPSQVVWTCKRADCLENLDLTRCEGPEDYFLTDDAVKYQDMYVDAELIKKMASQSADRIRNNHDKNMCTRDEL